MCPLTRIPAKSTGGSQPHRRAGLALAAGSTIKDHGLLCALLPAQPNDAAVQLALGSAHRASLLC